jgi:DNA-binding MarR family transcriptional regulator
MKPGFDPTDSPQTSPLQAQAIVEVCLCHHVRRTARAVTRLFDEALQPTGLKAGQFNILAAVAARDLTSAGEISQILAMDRTTLSRNLKPLREAGYVTTEGGAGRRPDVLSLTPSGQVIFSKAAALWRQAQGGLTERLGPGQAGVLLQTLGATVKAAE